MRKIVTTGGSEGLVASGVEFEHDGNSYVVSARREVVVSAGYVHLKTSCKMALGSRYYPRTIKSPQILELSGIGDRQVLEPLAIEVKLDLPGVGTNVQEHVTMGFARWSKLAFLPSVKHC